MKKTPQFYSSLTAVIFTALTFLCDIPVFAGSDAGTKTGQFLKIVSGARGTAMGEAYTALANDAFALDWNPAGITNIEHRSISFMHMQYLQETYLDYFSYAESSGDMGAWGISAKYMNYGEIQGTDDSGIDTSNFTPSDLALSVAFACYITGFNKDKEERFSMGAAGKIINSKIDNSDSTLSADMGILSPWYLNKHFRFALTGQNLFGSLRFDKEENDLPMVFKFGTLTRISKHFALTADIISSTDYDTFYAVGSELMLSPTRDMNISLRGGLNTRSKDEDINGSNTISLGAGVTFGIYSLDYSFVPFGELGNAHRISLSVNFKKPVIIKKRRRGT